MVEHLLDLLRVNNWDTDYCYVPYRLGVALVYGQMFGMGLLGLLSALWALFKLKSGCMGLLFLVFFTLVLPIVYGPLTGFFIDFSSKCGGAMVYIYFAPFCALPGSLPAWFIYPAAWIAHALRKRRKLWHNLPPKP